MRTLALNAEIIFPATQHRGEIRTAKVSAVEVESSHKLLTDRAKITLPRNVRFFDKNKAGEVFRRGDPVEVKLGYNGRLWTEFRGYITSASADMPVVLKCEDEMWKLKQLRVSVSMRDTTLPDLMARIAPGYKVDALEVELGKVRFANTTLAAVLDELKTSFGLYSYFQNGKLVVGKMYSDNSEAPARVHLEHDVVDNRLKYRRADDIRAKVKAVSTLKNGDKVEVEVGDEDGTPHQLSYYGITSKEELRKLAELDLEKMKVDGYEGDLVLFGSPYLQHGMKVDLQSGIYPDRAGRYYIASTKVTYNTATPEYRRRATIGKNGG